MKKILVLAVLLIPAAWAKAEDGGKETVDLSVSAVVAEACEVSADALVLSYTPGDQGPVVDEREIRITCNEGLSYTVAVGDGNHGEGGIRHVALGSGVAQELLAYELELSLGGSPWNPGASYTGTGTEETIKVKGTLKPPAEFYPAAGTYEDTVAVDVFY